MKHVTVCLKLGKKSEAKEIAEKAYASNAANETVEKQAKEISKNIEQHNNHKKNEDNDNNDEDGTIKLYNFKSNESLGEYDLVKAYKIGDLVYIITSVKGKYTLYQLTVDGLKECIDKDYKYMGIINTNDSKYVVSSLSTGSYLLDFDGEEISKLISKPIFDYDDEYIVTVKDDIYSLYNYKNELKLTDYKYISLEGDYIVLVDDSNKLYIVDKKLNKVNEEGYSLNNKYYLFRNVFNKENVKVKSAYAYNLDYNDENISLAVADALNTDQNQYFIKVEEYKYNLDLEYYSYFNGKLYFYEDEAKEKLLGSYTCDNKNNVKIGEELSKCHVAFDTIYEENDMTLDNNRVSMIPIYNKRFVFIEDDGDVKTVKLIDLVEKKILGTYESVNTYTTNNKGELNLATVNGNNVIAKNKSGKYGMISIGSTAVTSIYPFEYGYMEMIGGKVLALKDNNKWSIIYSKTSSSAEFDGKIRGFVGNISYFKIKKNGNQYRLPF